VHIDEERFLKQLTTCPRFALRSLMGSGFAPLAFAHSASARFWLAYARQNLAGRDRYVLYDLLNCGRLQRAWASGRQAQVFIIRITKEDVEIIEKSKQDINEEVKRKIYGLSYFMLSN